MDEELLEKMADEVHRVWSEWMIYMYNNNTTPNMLRWERQLETPYKDLSESEKESDRRIAKRYLEIMRKIK